MKSFARLLAVLMLFAAIPAAAPAASTKSAVSVIPQAKKPNILFIVSDDTGYGDLGPYEIGRAHV